jgi:hypothetical protein
MDTEPHDITTVSIRAFPPKPPEVRTLQDYQADLVRRFGRVPSWTELAKMENTARWHRNPASNMARPQVSATDHPNSRAVVEAIIAKGEATRTSIVAALTAPMTCPDVANALKRSPQLIRRHLGILAMQGRVTGSSVKGVTVWRKLEAAE